MCSDESVAGALHGMLEMVTEVAFTCDAHSLLAAGPVRINVLQLRVLGLGIRITLSLMVSPLSLHPGKTPFHMHSLLAAARQLLLCRASHNKVSFLTNC